MFSNGKRQTNFLRYVSRVHSVSSPLYERERKTHLTIAVGCTGGRHRSIVIVNRLAEILRDELTKRGVFLSVQTPRCGEGMRSEMVGVVVVTHCHLAEEIICAAQLVVGEELKQFQPFRSIQGRIRGDSGKDHRCHPKSRCWTRGTHPDRLYGGTPSNISLSFLEEKKIEVITGVNLPMLLKLATYQNDMDLEALAAFITDYGQRNINLSQ